MMEPVAPAQRGCGVRAKGGVYIEVPVGPVGTPWWKFLVDPPQPVEPDKLGLAPRGVTIKERPDGSGVYDIWDWVGSNHYPNVADFVEEGIRLGFSRRISRQSDFTKLDSRSRLVLVHARAWVKEFQAYLVTDSPDIEFHCPTQQFDHRLASSEQVCCGFWWEDIDPATAEPVYDPAMPYRTVERQMPSFAYLARRRPDDLTPHYQPAIFMVLPIPKLVVINDPEGGTHQAALAKARQAKLPVIVEES